MANMEDMLLSNDDAHGDFDSPYSVFIAPTSPKGVGSNVSKHKLITEGELQICRLNHTRTIVSKIMNSKYLRRWESHRIILDNSEIRSNTVCLTIIVYISHTVLIRSLYIIFIAGLC